MNFLNIIFVSVKQRIAIPTESVVSGTDQMTKTKPDKRWNIRCIMITSVIVICSLTVLVMAIDYTSNLDTKGKGIYNINQAYMCRV